MTLALTVLAAVLAADAGVPTTPANDPLQSPEVHPDGRVTFRLRAPRATQVSVAGEWSRPQATPNTPQPLARDAQGIWSLTVGPLEPNIYIYTFNVDGMTIIDPINPVVKLRARGAASMVEIPSRDPWELRDVPHGVVRVHQHAAAALGGAPRQVLVYTPPGYDAHQTTRYPVVYLLHGTNDLAVGWTMAGRANVILDNLIADKKAQPMVVVMPWGHALPFGAHPAAGQPSNNDLFERYLLEDVVPLVESNYRIAPGRRARAIVGLSMGGAQAMQIALGHGERFGSLGVFGSGLPKAEVESRFGKTLAAARFDLLFLGIGQEDPGLARAQELRQMLGGHRLAVTYREVTGGHTYAVWRKLLVEAAPLLFRRAAPGS